MFDQPRRQIKPNSASLRPRVKVLRRIRIRHLLRVELHLPIRRQRDEFKGEVGLLLRHAGAQTHGGINDGFEVFDVADLLLHRLGGFQERAQDVVADQLHGAFAALGAGSLVEDAGAVTAPFVELGDVFFIGIIF
jgi:hypothetical protein